MLGIKGNPRKCRFAAGRRSKETPCKSFRGVELGTRCEWYRKQVH
nr:MAG TPA: hypothetical protein [Caudoviricetes sp.]